MKSNSCYIFNILKINLFRQWVHNKKDDWTGEPVTDLLKRNDMLVQDEKEDQWLYAKVEFKRGEYQQPCNGDSGGPLMFENKQSKKWSIIGEFAPQDRNKGRHDLK